MGLVIVLTIINLAFLMTSVVFVYESVREQENRAAGFGIAGILFHLIIGLLILFVPSILTPILCMFVIFAIIGICFLLPGRRMPAKGSTGYIKSDVKRFDERDTVFARDALSKEKGPEAKKIYNRYYTEHPDLEERDAERRKPGYGIYGEFGRIDGFYRPNLSLDGACLKFPMNLLPYVKVSPEDEESGPEKVDPQEITPKLKSMAKHLGADLVGVCRVDERWVYSNQGDVFDEWDKWGMENTNISEYAIVIATEMDRDLLDGAPHSPADVEASFGYSKCAFVSSLIAEWVGGMGYKADIHDFAYNEVLLAPLAVDAGLGELGRFGYLIADKYGPRVRLAAVTTEMPLIPDKPISLGADEFCKRCLKCAESCPGKSIPSGDKVIHNGTERWKLDQERCFEYWYKAGTGCTVCMAVCTFSRPNRSVHKLIKWLLPRSFLARRFLPYVDNLVYGRKWKTKKVPEWVDYPKGVIADII